MKKQFLFLAMCIATILSANAQTSVWDGSHTSWTKGDGTQANPYQIENAAQLAHLAYIVNNGIGASSGRIVGANTYWKLMTDIDLKGSDSFQWTPIGYYNSTSDYYSFGGNFDGNNHTIANLFINTTTLQYIGLFGYTDGASIKNTGITGSTSVTTSVSTNACAGGIVGYANNTIFDNCYNTGNISASYTSTSYSASSGGIAGYAVGSGTTINNCYNTGNISSSPVTSYLSYSYSSTSYCGGIIGYIDRYTAINNCYNTGNISSSSSSSDDYSDNFYTSYSGGVIGYIAGDGTNINNCYNTGNISSSTTVNYSYTPYSGGIVGYIAGNGTTIINCSNAGIISTSNPASSLFSPCFGGIVGYIASSTIINNCFNTGNMSVSISYSSSATYFSGIVGYVYSAIINNCYNSGNISISFSNSASTYGYSYSSGIAECTYGIINNCYNSGTISSSYPFSYSAGIVGSLYNGTTINNCYNVGTLIGTYKGGIVASDGSVSVSGTVNNSYYLITCGGAGAGESKTEVFMKDAGFATILNNGQGFAYKSDVSPFVNNGYPVLTKGFDMQLRPVENIKQASATLQCLLNVGDVNITAKQLVCNNQTINLTSTDTLLTQTISGLIPNTAYSYTFRAINAQNDTCKLTGTFTTLPITVTTQDATNITQTKATLNGTVTFGDATVTKGFEYKLSTETNFTSVSVSGSNTNIVYNLTNLLPNGTYQFRAFYTISGNTTYGTVLNFTTLGVTTTTNPATNITRSTATLNGASSFGDATVIEQGFILTEPTGNDTIAVSNTTATLTYNTTDLAHGAAFSYKTYCTTAGGTVYGAVQNFNTPAFNTSGTDYLIEDKDDLILLANLVNGGNPFSGQTFVLANDITLPNTPNNILSIGDANIGRPFSGTFNGNGKRIYNVYIDQPNTPYQGFFGYTQNAYLYEVGLVNITASGRNYTGGMVGYADNTKIDNSYVSGGTLFALSYCGGLVGYQTPGTNSIITGCYNTCTVTGNNYVGGLLGYSDQGTVRNSYVAALVTGNGAGVGAIIGGAQDVLNYNCYFNDSITGQSFAIGENNISTASQRASGDGSMSSGDMRLQTFVTTLNQGLTTPVWKGDYSDPINNGFPILIWQSNQQTGIVKTTPPTSLKVYPNPAVNFVHIQSGAPVERVEIYSQSGACVLINTNVTDKLDVSGLANGTYLARIYMNGIPATWKIIIKK